MTGSSKAFGFSFFLIFRGCLEARLANGHVKNMFSESHGQDHSDFGVGGGMGVICDMYA